MREAWFEFTRQRDRLLELDCAALAGTPLADFTAQLDAVWPALERALGAAAEHRSPGGDDPGVSGRLAFVLVPATVPPEELIGRLHLAGRAGRPGSRGILDRNHGEAGLAGYLPIARVHLPPAPAYAVLDVERGEEFCSVAPREALVSLAARNRSPLTITEGLAAQAVAPGLLQPNRCFSLAGSRRGDKRVPALWISKGAPKLGWCWEGNPHTWLGTASAAGRLA